MLLDELGQTFVSSRTTEDSSSRRIMRLVPVFTLETNNQTEVKINPVQHIRRLVTPCSTHLL